MKRFRPAESLERDSLKPAELPAGCEEHSRFPALQDVTCAGVGFGDAAVCESFLLL